MQVVGVLLLVLKVQELLRIESKQQETIGNQAVQIVTLRTRRSCLEASNARCIGEQIDLSRDLTAEQRSHEVTRGFLTQAQNLLDSRNKALLEQQEANKALSARNIDLVRKVRGNV